MRRVFFVAALALVLFEAANVYFIMPLPYSQRMRSIDVAFFLHSWRWWIRAALVLAMVASIRDAWRLRGWQRWLTPAALLLAALVAYATNVTMSADHIFVAPTTIAMQPVARNVVEPTRLVVGVAVGGDARAYPLQFIGYHHQVRDSVGGRPILVSYCTVCRTGRVYSPIVDGRIESFRLVGMDHFNAMFEDKTTGSWWRQANGEAIAGPKKGTSLAIVPSQQVTLAQWLALHPTSLIMQPDATLRSRYASGFDYETGASRKSLTGTDTASWHDKAWVVGITLNRESKAYDWNRLRREGVVNDVVGGTPIVLVLAGDGASFFAFERPAETTRFVLRGDSLSAAGRSYAMTGEGTAGTLKPISASQEFWHSWRTFHPETKSY